MKILHFHDSPHIHGGATQYLNHVLAALSDAGHQNHLFSISPRIESINLAHHHAFEYKWAKSPIQRRKDFFGIHQPLADKLNAVIAEIAPDLIHIHNCATFRKTVFSTILYSELKSVMTVHDFSLNWNASPQLQTGGLKSFLANLANRPQHNKSRKILLDSVDMFLCPTKAIMDGLNLPVSKSLIHRLPIQPATQTELPTDKLRMFFAGTLFRSKGVDVLLDALSMLEPTIEFELEIAGSGDQLGTLQQQVTDYGLSDKARFLGHLSAAEMNGAYQRANLQVLPSRVPENSPLTVLEAGIRGRASIASHAGGVPELIPESRGWTFISESSPDLANKISAIANDLGILAVKGENMQKWVHIECDPPNHWTQLLSHYKQLIS
ncbi:MAG: glycosyltransferase family 4 protein [Planctomycetota bacterium]|nr:glycosyltransferase family 4 protein [Planctomycetota bacterium]